MSGNSLASDSDSLGDSWYIVPSPGSSSMQTDVKNSNSHSLNDSSNLTTSLTMESGITTGTGTQHAASAATADVPQLLSLKDFYKAVVERNTISIVRRSTGAKADEDAMVQIVLSGRNLNQETMTRAGELLLEKMEEIQSQEDLNPLTSYGFSALDSNMQEWMSKNLGRDYHGGPVTMELGRFERLVGKPIKTRPRFSDAEAKQGPQMKAVPSCMQW